MSKMNLLFLQKKKKKKKAGFWLMTQRAGPAEDGVERQEGWVSVCSRLSSPPESAKGDLVLPRRLP